MTRSTISRTLTAAMILGLAPTLTGYAHPVPPTETTTFVMVSADFNGNGQLDAGESFDDLAGMMQKADDVIGIGNTQAVMAFQSTAVELNDLQTIQRYQRYIVAIEGEETILPPNDVASYSRIYGDRGTSEFVGGHEVKVDTTSSGLGASGSAGDTGNGGGGDTGHGGHGGGGDTGHGGGGDTGNTHPSTGNDSGTQPPSTGGSDPIIALRNFDDHKVPEPIEQSVAGGDLGNQGPRWRIPTNTRNYPGFSTATQPPVEILDDFPKKNSLAATTLNAIVTAADMGAQVIVYKRPSTGSQLFENALAYAEARGATIIGHNDPSTFPLDVDDFQLFTDKHGNIQTVQWNDLAGGSTVEPCRGDFNHDGMVNASDLLQLLDNWGRCDTCGFNIAGDSRIDVQDLIALLSTWGFCE